MKLFYSRERKVNETMLTVKQALTEWYYHNKRLLLLYLHREKHTIDQNCIVSKFKQKSSIFV